MALVLKDRVQETTTTTGTGTLTLAGAVSGFQSFSAIGNGNTCYYVISGGTEWEVGLGTYTSSGTTLSRDTVLSSSAGGTTKVTLSAGTKNVFVTYPADKSVTTDVIGTIASQNSNNVSITGGSIAVTANPTASLEVATKQYVDAAVTGLHVHDAVSAATTAALSGTVTYDNGTSGVGATLTLGTALTTLDGWSLSNGERILVKNQTNAAHNGIYTWATGGTVLTRATDADTTTELNGGEFFFVVHGTVNNDTGWIIIDPVTTIGTSNVNFTQFSGAGTYTAGTGLTLNGSQFSIDSTVATLTGSQTLTNKTLTSPTLTSPTLTTPVLGTPSSGTLTNATGLPLSTGVTGTLPIANGGTNATTAAQANANLQGYTTTATSDGQTSLTNSSTYYQYFTGTQPEDVRLPLNTTIQNGWAFHIVNNSSNNLTIKSNSGATVATVLPNVTAHVTCTNATVNTAAAWDYGFTDFNATIPVSLGGTGVTNSTGSGTKFVLDTSPEIASPTFTSQSGFAAGTTSLPSIARSNDTNTGMWFPAADTIAFSEGGTEAMRITSSGGISFGSSGTAYGTSGQVLTSNGNAAPTWNTLSSGGNSVTAISSGTITQGKLVLRQGDGTVIQMTGTNSALNYTSGQFGPNTPSVQSTLNCAINSAGTTILVLSRTNSSNNYSVTAGTISGTSITFGTPVSITISSATSTNMLAQTVTYDVALDRWLITYGTATNGQIAIRVVTVAGTTPTLGTAITLSASTTNGVVTDASYDVASGKHVLVYIAATTNYPTANVYTISGTTVTAGTPVTLESVITAPVSSNYQAGTLKIEYDALSSKNIVLYRQNTLGNLKVNMVTVSGTTVTLGTSVDTGMAVQVGSVIINDPQLIYRNIVVVDSNRSRYIVIAGQGASLTAKEYTLSGANLSFAANLTFSSGSYASSAFYDATSSVLSVVCESSLHQYKYSSALSNTYYLINNAPSNSVGTSQSHLFKLGTNTLLSVANNLYFDPNFGCGGGQTSYGYINISTTATSNLQLGVPIGVPTATYTTGQTANIAYSGSGSIVAGFTGLPVPTTYYYDNTNTLGSTSIPTGFAVRALTDTQVVVL